MSQKMASPLDWENSPFQYRGMLKIDIMKSKSSWFHAVLKGFSKLYMNELSILYMEMTSYMRRGERRGEPPYRTNEDLVIKTRNSLADRLVEENPDDPKGRTYYQCLRGGTLEERAKEDPFFSLEIMAKELRTGQPYDSIYHEFISNVLKRDIYILDQETKDVHLVSSNMSLFYKNRGSVVLLRTSDHYDLVVVADPYTPCTHFSTGCPFIKAIRKRMRQKIDSGEGPMEKKMDSSEKHAKLKTDSGEESSVGTRLLDERIKSLQLTIPDETSS